MSESDNLEHIGHAMMLAWGRIKKSQARMWGDWMAIGEGLLEGRRWAMHMAGTNKPEGKGYVVAFGEWLKRYRVDDMDKSDRAKLLQLMEERPGVEEWRATLTDYERRNLNNPTMAWRKWTAATRIKKPKPRSAGISAGEHGRAQGTIQQLQARISELEEETAPDALALLRLLIPKAVDEKVTYGGFDEMVADLVACPDLGFNRTDLETLGDLITLMVANMPEDEGKKPARPSAGKRSA